MLEEPGQQTHGRQPNRAAMPVTAKVVTSAADCRRVLGWQIVTKDGGPWLQLARGMTALALPSARGKQLLKTLGEWDQRGPVLEVLERSLNWVFLTDDNGLVMAQHELAPCVRLLRCPAAVPLPTAGNRITRWIVPPTSDRRWLPTLTTVVGALRAQS